MNMISRDERKKEKGLYWFILFGFNKSGFLFKVSVTEWALLALTIGMVLSLELVNTAIEAVVDLVTEEYHPLAKVAKDTSAAAVFVCAIAAVVVGLIIFLPKVIDLLF